jgi:hypothetical protein
MPGYLLAKYFIYDDKTKFNIFNLEPTYDISNNHYSDEGITK